MTAAGPARGLVVDRAARLLVVPRPDGAAGGRAGRPRSASRARLLDVGSADGPSVGWMRGDHQQVSRRPRPARAAPRPGRAAPPRWRCPFGDAHASTWWRPSTSSSTASPRPRRSPSWPGCWRPGGRLLLSVPAYQWAWSRPRRPGRPPPALHAAAAGRGGRGRRVRGRRCTYAFAGVFPVFAAERLAAPAAGGGRRPTTGCRSRRRPRWSGCCSGCPAPRPRWLRRRDLPFGSSVFLARPRSPVSSRGVDAPAKPTQAAASTTRNAQQVRSRASPPTQQVAAARDRAASSHDPTSAPRGRGRGPAHRR